MRNRRIIALLLSVLSVLTAQADYTLGKVMLDVNGQPVAAEALFDYSTGTVIIGNGQNACIPQYTEGVLTIPASVSVGMITYRVEVGQLAFRLCNSLTEIIVSEDINKIGDFAFVGCSSVQKITLPSSLNYIGSGAFVNMASLKKMICHSTEPPIWGYNDLFAHEGTPTATSKNANQRTLYVPRMCGDGYRRSKYQNQVGWEEAFGHISESAVPTKERTVSNFNELVELSNDVAASQNGMADYVIRLTADLVFEPTINERTQWFSWVPIGTAGHPFKGVFDGGGHTIKNVKEYNPHNDAGIGLFGYAEAAEISNLVLQNVSMKGSNHVGVVAGSANHCSIHDILVYDAVTASGAINCAEATAGDAGGIVGYAQDSKIDNCYFYGKVKGTTSTGGIVGTNSNMMTITDCTAANAIDGGSGAVGGIVGTADTQTTVTRSYSRAQITGTTSTVKGGIVGSFTSTQNSITHSAYLKGNSTLPSANTTSSGTAQLSDVRACATVTDMQDHSLQDVIGQGQWHFFHGDMDDFPVQESLVDEYLHLAGMRNSDGFIFKEMEDDCCMIVGYDGAATDITLPQTYKDLSVTAVGERAFAGKPLTGVVLHDFIRSIGKEAFADCTELKSLTLGRYITGSGYSGWLDRCINLEHLSQSTGSGYVELDIFYNPDKTCLIRCTPRHSSRLEIPATVTSIAPGAFANCNQLALVDMSATTPQWRVDRKLASSPFYDASKYTVFVMNEVSQPAANEPNVIYKQFSTDRYFTCKELLLTEGLGFVAPISFYAYTVRLDRKLTAAAAIVDGDDTTDPYYDVIPKAFTFHVPFKPQIPHSKGVKLYTYNGTTVKADGTTYVKFQEVGYDPSYSFYYDVFSMHMNYPYYIVTESADPLELANEDAGNNLIPAGSSAGYTEKDGYIFMGTNTLISNSQLYDATQPRYILQSDMNWHRVPQNQPKAYVNPFRCYFKAGNTLQAAKVLTPSFSDDGDIVTGIDNTVVVATDNDGNSRYFDVNGRLLPGRPQQGLYIHNRRTYRAK